MKLRNFQLGALITGTEASEFLPSAAPDLAGPGNAAAPSGCGDCYLIADVAGEHDARTERWRFYLLNRLRQELCGIRKCL